MSKDMYKAVKRRAPTCSLLKDMNIAMQYEIAAGIQRCSTLILIFFLSSTRKIFIDR
jgi:hypothetical protein